MKLVVRKPPASLAPFVASIWFYDGAHLAVGRELVVPTGASQLLVNLDDDTIDCWDGPGFDRHVVRAGAVLSGPYARAVALETRGQRRITGVALRPGAAPVFTGFDAAHAASEMVEIDDFAPRSRLRERMLEAHGVEAVLDLWECFLVAQLRGGVDLVVEHARLTLDRGARVGDVARELGLSMPRLRARFSARVGLTPKRYARVRRVQRVIGAVAGEAQVSWARIAIEQGYADQAHLVRELREIAGVTPTAYRPRLPGENNHVPLE